MWRLTIAVRTYLYTALQTVEALCFGMNELSIATRGTVLEYLITVLKLFHLL